MSEPANLQFFVTIRQAQPMAAVSIHDSGFNAFRHVKFLSFSIIAVTGVWSGRNMAGRLKFVTVLTISSTVSKNDKRGIAETILVRDKYPRLYRPYE